MDLSRGPDENSPLHRPDALDTRHVPEPQFSDGRIDHLRRVSLFAECTDVELRRIADISRIAEHPAGSVLTKVGTPGDSFFLIIDGRVSVETPVGIGDPLHPGDFFGEMSLLDGDLAQPRSSQRRRCDFSSLIGRNSGGS